MKYNTDRNLCETESSRMPKAYISKIHGGVLGKIIGVRLGIPFENYSASEVQQKVPYVDGYVGEKGYHNMRASGALMHPDDDTNGFAFFIKMFEKIEKSKDLTADIVAHTILNTAAYCRGFFWWDDYGTEKQAFSHLLAGVSAEQCGDEAHIGDARHHVGGQIFYDAIGLIFAGNPNEAARCAGIAANVMHHGEGAYGGQFLCACISAAFITSSIPEIIEMGLRTIPSKSNYAQMVRNVMAFHEKNPYDWNACLHYIDETYYTHYVWDYAARIILALLYGNGNFSRTMEICLQCGGDTDCNCGNAGTIVGVLCGSEAIHYHRWCAPLNDTLYCSSTLGYENEVSITQLTARIIDLHCKFRGYSQPAYLKEAAKPNRYSFALPNAQQGFQPDFWRDHVRQPMTAASSLWTVKDEVTTLSGSPYALKFWAWHVQPNDVYRVYRRFSHMMTEFSSCKYEPTLCTRLYPGQKVSVNVMTQDNSCNMYVRFCVYSSAADHDLRSEPIYLKNNQWVHLEYQLPQTDHIYDYVNIEIIPEKPSVLKDGFDGMAVYLDDFAVSGVPDYLGSFQQESVASYYPMVKDFTVCYGWASAETGSLVLDGGEYPTMAFTGPADMYDYCFSCTIECTGNYHLLNVAVKGAAEHYAVGFWGKEKIAILKSGSRPFTYTELCSRTFAWQEHVEYALSVQVRGRELVFLIDQQLVLRYEADTPLSGCVGLTCLAGNQLICRNYQISPVGI